MKCADSIRAQLLRTMNRYGLEIKSPDFNSKEYYLNIRKCLLAGFFMQVRRAAATAITTSITTTASTTTTTTSTSHLLHLPSCRSPTSSAPATTSR